MSFDIKVDEKNVRVNHFTVDETVVQKEEIDPALSLLIQKTLNEFVKSVQRTGTDLSHLENIRIKVSSQSNKIEFFSEQGLLFNCKSTRYTKALKLLVDKATPPEPVPLTPDRCTVLKRNGTKLLKKIGGVAKYIFTFQWLRTRKDEDTLLSAPALDLAAKPVDTGKSIKEPFIVNSTAFGRECVERMDTLALYEKMLKEEIRLAEHRGKDPQAAYADLHKLVDYKRYRDAHEQQKDWVVSYDFREMCQRQSLQEATKSFPFGVPVNLRTHTISPNEEDKSLPGITVGRLGVIAYMGNGAYSLEELEAMKKALQEGDDTLIYEKCLVIRDFIENPVRSEVIPKALAKIGIKSGELEGYLASSAERNYDQLVNAYVQSQTGNLKALDRLIDERERPLNQQMLIYLYEQMRSHKENLKSGESFNLVHLGLLDLHKHEIDVNGIMHDEQVQNGDMRAIFQKFQGKQILFSSAITAPILANNVIVMPADEMGLPNGSKMDLNTFQFTICPQGYPKNDDPQRTYNHDEFVRLVKLCPELKAQMDDPVIKRLLVGKTTGYDLAEDFLYFLARADTKQKLTLSAGCMSGKDRTGFVLARLAMRYLNEYLARRGIHENPLEKKVLAPGGVASRIVNDNTPKKKVLKVYGHMRGLDTVAKIKLVVGQLKETAGL